MEASIFEQLAAPIEKTSVKRKKITWKDKKTGEFKSYETDYITARVVMNRLDRVVGPQNWSDDYIDRPNGSVRCILSIRIDGEWVSKSDVGNETDIEGDKGAYSEAFKRAAVKWGIGRELYEEGTAYEPAPRKGNGAPAKPAQQPAKAKAPEQPAPQGEITHIPGSARLCELEGPQLYAIQKGGPAKFNMHPKRFENTWKKEFGARALKDVTVTLDEFVKRMQQHADPEKPETPTLDAYFGQPEYSPAYEGMVSGG